jgi:PAS domain S-box-containing protein
LDINTTFLLTRLIDASVDGIFAFDRDCKIIAWNKAMERISGFSSAAMIGKRVVDVFPFLRESGSDECFAAALAGKGWISESHPYGPSESGVFESHYSPLFDEDGNVAGGVAVITDITARKQAQEAAQTAYRQLAFHVESSPLAVIEWDSDFRVSRWSESAERLFGWKADDVIGKHVNEWRFVFADDEDAVALVTNRQREGVEVQGVQRNRNYTRAGSVLFCEWYNSVLHDDRGKLVSVLSLVLDVTARQSAEEERAASLLRERDARRHAEEADRLKDEFLATLSHELRTPLTTITGWLQIIDLDRGQGRLERGLDAIHRNTTLLTRLIADLVDVSRIVTGTLTLQVQPTDVARVVDAALDSVRQDVQIKELQVVVNAAPDVEPIAADPDRLQQVVRNLLSNAVKFTPAGGRISIGARRQGSMVELSVADTGSGIRPEFLPHVFDRFSQQDGGKSRQHGGMGLGLAIVRHLVDMHAGTVRVSSVEGKGTTFTVTLPVSMDAARTENAAPATPKHQLVGVHVLVVDDDVDSREVMARILEDQGATVATAASAAEAYELLLRARPHVLVCDIGMAHEDGLSFIRRLRRDANRSIAQVPALAVTAFARDFDRQQSEHAGFQSHVAKPFESAELVGIVRRLAHSNNSNSTHDHEPVR